MKKRLIYFMICLLGSGITAQAQYTYTLKQCLEEGLANNYSLRITRNEEQISKNNATLGNAGYLPTVDLTAGYTGNADNSNTKARATGETTKLRGVYDQTLDAGVDLNWTIFDGFNNFRYAVSLSRERLRIVEERYHIGNFSRLDYQQATVDFNADRAQYIKQRELVHTSRINLNELMAAKDMDRPLSVKDSVIDVNESLEFNDLWEGALQTNASLLQADQNTVLAQLDYKKVLSRNYPYVRLNAGYGYTLNKYDVNATRQRSNWGFSGGVTIGFNIFDGNRKREKRNASLAIRNAQFARDELEQSLRADLSNLWQAYRNNLRLLELERQNLVSAKENHEIAKERYLLGDLSGIEMREAQKSLLDAEERILSAEYDTKMCEISLLQLSGKVTQYLK